MFLLGCYGVPPAKASEEWMCSRCSANALEEVSIPVCFPPRPEGWGDVGASWDMTSINHTAGLGFVLRDVRASGSESCVRVAGEDQAAAVPWSGHYSL